LTVKEIKEYKGSLTADLARDLSSFETNFILLAGGLLAFSITFIKDIVKIQDAQGICLLFLGWLLLAAAMGIMMFTWLYSSNASHEIWRRADSFMNANRLFKDDIELTDIQAEELKKQINDYFLPAKRNLKQLRNGAVIIFLVGLTAFAAFVGSNLVKENQTKPPTGGETRYLLFGKDSLKINSSDTILILKRK
jgi:hypothetical protein